MPRTGQKDGNGSRHLAAAPERQTRGRDRCRPKVQRSERRPTLAQAILPDGIRRDNDGRDGCDGIDPRTLPAQRDQRSTRHLSLFIDHARIEVIEQDQGYPLTRTSSLRARQNYIRDCEGGHSYNPAPGASDFLLRGHHF